MRALVLSQYKTYVFPVMNHDGIKITEQVVYGGEDSLTVPCGFVSQLVYQKTLTKKQKKNARHRKKPTKTLTQTRDNRGLGVTNMKS